MGAVALVLRRRVARNVVIVAAAALWLAGCASYARRYAQANEEGLVAAGFDRHPADTPEKLAVVVALRQRRVLVYQRPEGLYYVWPDARFCRCLYVGDEPRYQTYVRLGLEQKLERERATAAEEREAAALLASAREFGWGFGW